MYEINIIIIISCINVIDMVMHVEIDSVIKEHVYIATAIYTT